jgi:hypothetical protein
MDDDPEEVCAFCGETMFEGGWRRLVYQAYAEGSCMGTWMSGDGQVRVLLTGGRRRSDERSFVGIIMGRDCP